MSMDLSDVFWESGSLSQNCHCPFASCLLLLLFRLYNGMSSLLFVGVMELSAAYDMAGWLPWLAVSALGVEKCIGGVCGQLSPLSNSEESLPLAEVAPVSLEPVSLFLDLSVVAEPELLSSVPLELVPILLSGIEPTLGILS